MEAWVCYPATENDERVIGLCSYSKISSRQGLDIGRNSEDQSITLGIIRVL
jgi:hypothetical protein